MKKILILATFLLSLSATASFADMITGNNTYNDGGVYNTIYMIENGVATAVGAGSMSSATLNGQALPFDYCVDLFTYIYYPDTYTNTIVSDSALIKQDAVNALNGTTPANPLTNAGQVAWLLDTYAMGARSDVNMQAALQAVIWEVIYGYNVAHLDLTNSSAAVKADYAAIMANFSMSDVGNVSNYLWITPMSGSTMYQAQVTLNPSPKTAVPEPGTIALLGTGLVGLAFYRKRRKAA